MRKREGKGNEGRNERRKECSFSGMVIGNKNVKKKRNGGGRKEESYAERIRRKAKVRKKKKNKRRDEEWKDGRRLCKEGDRKEEKKEGEEGE